MKSYRIHIEGKSITISASSPVRTSPSQYVSLLHFDPAVFGPKEIIGTSPENTQANILIFLQALTDNDHLEEVE